LVIEDGPGGGVEEFAAVGGGEVAGFRPGPCRQPLFQDLDQVPGEKLVLVGGVGGVCTMRAPPEAARDVLATCPQPGCCR
jgi:hypothetical protein